MTIDSRSRLLPEIIRELKSVLSQVSRGATGDISCDVIGEATIKSAVKVDGWIWAEIGARDRSLISTSCYNALMKYCRAPIIRFILGQSGEMLGVMMNGYYDDDEGQEHLHQYSAARRSELVAKMLLIAEDLPLVIKRLQQAYDKAKATLSDSRTAPGYRVVFEDNAMPVGKWIAPAFHLISQFDLQIDLITRNLTSGAPVQQFMEDYIGFFRSYLDEYYGLRKWQSNHRLEPVRNALLSLYESIFERLLAISVTKAPDIGIPTIRWPSHAEITSSVEPLNKALEQYESLTYLEALDEIDALADRMASDTVTVPTRMNIPMEVKRLVFARDGGKCRNCNSQFLIQFDHVIPIAKGGASTAENLQLLCQSCNQKKRDHIA